MPVSDQQTMKHKYKAKSDENSSCTFT